MIREGQRSLRLRLLLVVTAILSITSCDRHASNSDVRISNLASLIEVSPDKLEKLDIARMNLLCAEGLPGAEQLDITNLLAAVDQMAARVKSETERHLYRFQKNPSEFESSEGFFRMTMLMVVLAEDCRVRYAPNKMATAANASMGDGFFANSQDVFLHGLTGATRQGTCSSLPVLYVAVGRLLGYPLKLVTTKGHLFVRWEDSGHNNFALCNLVADNRYENCCEDWCNASHKHENEITRAKYSRQFEVTALTPEFPPQHSHQRGGVAHPSEQPDCIRL